MSVKQKVFYSNAESITKGTEQKTFPNFNAAVE